MPAETLSQLVTFLKDHHDNTAVYTFHRGNRDFIEKLKYIFKNVPEIYQLLKENTYVVTRKASGESANAAYKPHFDNYDSTVLVPLVVPESDFNGDIYLWEKARKYPKNVIWHLIIKIFFQNKISNFLLIKTYKWNKKFKRYTIKPGQFLIFDGFVDLHFNIHVDYGERLSLLIHNNKKFSDSKIVQALESYSIYWANKFNRLGKSDSEN
jgi:hypothetical protein